MYIRSLLTLVAGAWLAAATSTERNPLRSTGRIADPSIQTSTHRANSLSSFNLDFDLPDVSRRIRLSLEPNHDVIPEGARVTHLNADGTTKKRRPIERHEHKIYKGVARSRRDDGTWSQVGTARISLRRDGLEPLFEGTFSVNHDHHHILSRSSYVRTKQALDPEVEKAGQEFMVYFRDSDMVSPRLLASEYNTELKRDVDGHTCYANELSSNWNSLTGTFSAQESNLNSGYGAVLGKRQSQIDTQPGSGNTGGVDLSSTIGQTAGCPSTRKVALVGVATDCGYTSQFDDEDAVHQNIVSVMNSASGVFESAFNISLGLKDITVLDAECPGTPNAATPWNQGCSDSVDIQQRLNLFSTWRNTLNDNNSHWTLLTKCNTGTAVGLAWVGRACMSPSQGSQVQSASNETVAGANVVALTGTEWQVVA